MRIDASGNVGIGNTNPNLPLTVTSNSGANAIAIRARSADDYGFMQFYNHAGTTLRGQIFNHNGAMAISTDTTGTARLHIDTSGNVGIGTTSPSVPLHINSTSGVSNRLAIFESDINNTNEYSTISVGHNQLSANFGLMLTTSDTAYIGVGSSGNAFDPTTGTGLYVNANGNVGIGISSPDTLLELRKDTASSSYGVYPTLSLRNDNAAGYHAIHFQEGSTQRARVEVGNNSGTPYMGLYTTSGYSGITIKNGYVGIDDSTPGHKLEVNSTENYKAIHIKGTNAPCYTMARGDSTNAEWRMGLSGYDYNDFAISSGTGTNDRFRMDPDGNMILGSANNVTPRDMHNISATVSVSGPIASGYSMGTSSTGPMNVRDWFVYNGPAGGQSRYVHMKTDLWAGGSPNGNVEYTMSLFRYHSAYSYGSAKVSEGMIGWHNWSGSTAHQRSIYNPVSNWAIVKESYTSSDGYVVLVADTLTTGTYTQFSIDWFQWAGYPFRERKVTAVTTNASATGAY